MKKKVLWILFLTFAPASAFAGTKSDGLWLGGIVGQQKEGSLKPLAYGASLGGKRGTIGGEALFLTGTKKSGIIEEEITQILGRLDLFAGKAFYLGPEVGHTTLKATASVAGVSAAVKSSAIVYGGGGGFNLPLGGISIGADVSYVTGSFDGAKTNILSYAGTLKLWF